MTTSTVTPELPKLTIARRAKWRSTEGWENERTDLHFFRSQTIAIVRHFFEIASQIGRLPSIMGREFFRAKVSHHAIPSFEEQAVFVHDVERALNRLNDDDAEVVALAGLFQFTLDDVAAMLGCSRSGVAQRYSKAIDQLAETFLEFKLLRENRPDRYPQRFPAVGQTIRHTDLLPKKPPVSVSKETYHIVEARNGGFSFAVQRQEA